MRADRNTQVALTRKVVKLRAFRKGVSLRTPRFVEVDEYSLRGEILKRIRIILRGNGCSKPSCTMCPLPNEGLDRKEVKVDAEDYIKQVAAALEAYPGCEMVCIYNDGSFFAERELPANARRAIYQLTVFYGARYLVVESLPQFITNNSLAEAKDLLEEIHLIVGIGLQSASDFVREICINSPVTKEAFLNALRLLDKYGFGSKVYVMIKPPFLSEDEAIEDATSSVMWLNNLQVEDITLCPTRIAQGTLVFELFRLRLYYPPMLTTIVDCLRNIQRMGGRARVSVFNVYSSDFQSYTSGGCSECEERIIHGLQQFNRNPASVDLATLSCAGCHFKARWINSSAFENLAPADRVQRILKQL